jgi:hypothetical protein
MVLLSSSRGWQATAAYRRRTPRHHPRRPVRVHEAQNLYRTIEPIFRSYGFSPPSAGVISRDLSEKIEISIVQHCPSFSKGEPHCDLSRNGHEWEVKICKDSGLTVNQSKQINGENYIVVNYKANSDVMRIWVLWDAQDSFFSARKPNTNARAVLSSLAAPNIETIYAKAKTQIASPSLTAAPRAKMARAKLPDKAKRQSA